MLLWVGMDGVAGDIHLAKGSCCEVSRRQVVNTILFVPLKVYFSLQK